MIVDSTTGTNTATRWKRKPKGLVEQPGEEELAAVLDDHQCDQRIDVCRKAFHTTGAMVAPNSTSLKFLKPTNSPRASPCQS